MADEGQASAADIWVSCGKEIEEQELLGLAIDQDLGQPDMCVLTLKNDEHTFSNGVKHGDAVEVKSGGTGGTTLFKGEVVGIEPSYVAGGESKCVIRAFNRLHRLLRGRKSRTFLDQTDQDIVNTLAGDSGLSAQCGSDTKITHEHIYQHNQTDLEFLRIRAARIGYEVWVEDKTLYFEKPKTDADSGVKLVFDESEEDLVLQSFSPRLSSAGMVEKVIVRGWDPDKKEEIVGEAKSKSSKLGTKTGDKASKPAFGAAETFEVDHPIFSVEEAKAIAEARLGDSLMEYITGVGVVKGTEKLKPGIVVTITVNPDKADDRFNGKYLVVGTSHRYSHSAVPDQGGFITSFKVSRDAEGG